MSILLCIYTHQHSIDELFVVFCQLGHTAPKFLQPVDDLSILSEERAHWRTKVRLRSSNITTLTSGHVKINDYKTYLYVGIGQLVFQQFVVPWIPLQTTRVALEIVSTCFCMRLKKSSLTSRSNSPFCVSLTCRQQSLQTWQSWQAESLKSLGCKAPSFTTLMKETFLFAMLVVLGLK